MKELAKAVCRVMQAVRYVPETGKNKFHGYTYASDEDLLTVVQPAMAENGLSLIPTVVQISTTEHSPDGKGKPQWRTDLVVAYTLLHTSGEMQVVQAPGCGIDGEDKGTYKAMTGALKYALRHMFLVPTGQDAERAEAPPPKRQGRQQHDTEPTAEHRRAAEDVKAERDRATAERQGKHHPSWDADRASWCAAVQQHGLNPDVAMDVIAAASKGVRPSAMDTVRRAKALQWLTSPDGALAYDAAIAEREREAS